MTRNGLIGVLVVMTHLAVAAQAPAVVEVSSIKVSQQSGDRMQILPSGLRYSSADLMIAVPRAYNIHTSFTDTRIDWSKVDRALLRKLYEIDIRGTGAPMALLRMVLAERFGLRTHTETRQTPLAALTVKNPGRLGPRLKPSTVNCRELSAAGVFRKPGGRPPQCDSGDRSAGSIADLIERAFPRYMKRPVVDRTGLTGNYEWEIKVAPQTGDDYEQLVRDAFEDQLGLTLKDITGPYDVLVIDALHEPTQN